MDKATLAEAWAFAERVALNGLVSFAHVQDRAEPLGINNRHFMRLCKLGFLNRENDSRRGHRVMYRLCPNPPPVERLAEEDRKPGRRESASFRS